MPDIVGYLKQNISIIDYAEKNGLTPLRISDNNYTLKEIDSMNIDVKKNIYYRHSVSKGGSIIDFAMEINNSNFRNAVLELREYANMPDYTPSENIEPKKLQLPPPTKGKYTRAVAYLSKTRCLDIGIISDLIKSKNLYQDEKNNAVFVGYDYENKAQFGFKRGTLTDVKYSRDCPGSNKSIGFHLNNNPNNEKLIVTEAIIDSLSMASMLKINKISYKSFNYLSLNGISEKSLLYHLENNPQINKVYLSLDNDNARAFAPALSLSKER